MSGCFVRIFITIFIMLNFTTIAFPEFVSYSPFFWNTDTPSVAFLHGELKLSSYSSLLKLLNDHPNVKIIALSSPGGYVNEGLKIADEIHKNHMTTWVPKNAECSSACSFIFFAGIERRLDGRLGVHQLSGVNDIEYAQLNVADILTQLNNYGVDPRIFPIMLKTSADQIYYFNDNEKREFQFDTRDVNAQSKIRSSLEKEEQAKNFVISLVLYSGTPSLERLKSLYLEKVEYYGKIVSRDDVINDKKHFFHNWPERKNSVKIETVKVTCNRENFCSVTGEFTWLVSNQKNRMSLSGRSEFFYRILITDNLLIASESNKRIK